MANGTRQQMPTCCQPAVKAWESTIPWFRIQVYVRVWGILAPEALLLVQTITDHEAIRPTFSVIFVQLDSRLLPFFQPQLEWLHNCPGYCTEK